MERNNFAVQVLPEINNYQAAPEQAINGFEGYVILPAREEGVRCRIRLQNHSGRRCNAYLHLDNKLMGVYRLSGQQVWDIERSGEDDGIFTLYPSVMYQDLASEVSSEDRGVIKVRFVPEVKRQEVLETLGGTRGFDFGATRGMPATFGTRGGGEKGLGSGFFASSGHSSQQFGKATEIDEDKAAAVEIKLRAVTQQDDRTPRRLNDIRNITPPPVADF